MPECLCDSYTARVGNRTWSPQGTAKLSRGTETQWTDRHKVPATHRGTEIINRQALDTRKNTPQLQKPNTYHPRTSTPGLPPPPSLCLYLFRCLYVSVCLSFSLFLFLSFFGLSFCISVCLSVSVSHACACAHTHAHTRTHTHTLPKYTMETEPEDPPNTTSIPPCLPTSLSSSFF